MSRVGGAYGGRPDREKRYVAVVSETTADGLVTPLQVVWPDGRRFRIDRVTDRRQAHSLKTGGVGIRYTIRVGGTETHLWHDTDQGRWFVEAKVRADADWGC